MTILFWFSAAVLFYVYLGYPLLLWIASSLSPKPTKRAPVEPTVSILLSVFNEEAVLPEKLENLLCLDYPREKREILVGSDGSTDRTEAIVKGYEKKGVRLVASSPRAGKPRMLNRLARQATGDVLVFTDARQTLDPKAIRFLVENFADPSVGCVSGELLLESRGEALGEGVGFYWSYEKFIRQKESAIDSVIGATGALYALRKSLFRELPDETILDDVYLPMQAVSLGFRTLFEPRALVFDEVSSSARKEYDRKVRTLAGNYQSFIQLAPMLNPFQSRVAAQFLSHNLLRILAPFFLIALFLSNGYLLKHPFYRILFIGQMLFYGVASLGALAPAAIRRFFSAPYVFCLLNLSALAGLYRFLTGRQQVTWKTK